MYSFVFLGIFTEFSWTGNFYVDLLHQLDEIIKKSKPKITCTLIVLSSTVNIIIMHALAVVGTAQFCMNHSDLAPHIVALF